MATVDTSIYRNVVQPADFTTPLRMLAAGQGIAQARGEMRAQERAEARRQTLADLMRTHTNQSGETDRSALAAGIAQAGYGDALPEMQQQWAATDKATADASAAQFNQRKALIDYTHGALQSLLSRPRVTTDDAIQVLQGMVQQGLLTPEQGAQQARALPGDPVQLRQYLVQAGLQTLEAKQRFDAVTPQVQAQNLGGHTQMVDTNPLTNPNVVGQTFRRSMTPGEAESARHNRVSEGLAARRFEAERSNPVGQPFEVTQNGAPVLVQRYGDGSLRPVEGFSPKVREGMSITTNPDGTVSVTTGGAKPQKLTEQQSKDLVYLTRGEAASPILDTLGSQLADPAQRAAGAVPLAGNAMVSPDYQRADQAGREFLAAVLRKDTGAAITSQEFDIYGKMYLPQPFDSPEVLEQKRQARRVALDAIRSGLGPAGEIAPPRSNERTQEEPAPQGQPNPPTVGDVVDGYLFTGGDPSQQSNWRKVR